MRLQKIRSQIKKHKRALVLSLYGCLSLPPTLYSIIYLPQGNLRVPLYLLTIGCSSALLINLIFKEDPQLTILRGLLIFNKRIFPLFFFLMTVLVLLFPLGYIEWSCLVLFFSFFLFLFWYLSPSSSRLIEKINKALLLISSLVAFLFLIEIFARIPAIKNRLPHHAVIPRIEIQPEDYDKHSFVTWKGIKFRSMHLNEPKDPSTLRILTLGDSFTWGDKVLDTHKIWPYILEASLNSEGHLNKKVEVLNLAQMGFTTINQFEILQALGWSLEPDIVIIQYLINDPLPSGPGLQRVGGEWMAKKIVPLAFFDGLHAKLNHISIVYYALNQQWTILIKSIFKIRDLDYFDLHKDGFIHWERTKEAISMMGKETRSRNTHLLFTFFPVFPAGKKLNKNYPYQELHDKLRHVVEGNDIRFFDLLPVFAKTNPKAEDWHILSYDSHPSLLAHKIAGIAISNKLIDLGWID